MGRLSKTFCCCFGSSSYEIAPDTDDLNTVILKNNNQTESDLTEKLLQNQHVQIKIKPKNQQEFLENIEAKFVIKKENDDFQGFLELDQKRETKIKLNAADPEMAKENKQSICRIQQQNVNLKKILNLHEQNFNGDDYDDEDLKIKFELKK